MDQLKKPPSVAPVDPPEDNSRADRRRVGRVVHDERGAAILEWQEIPPERTGSFERLRLSIEDEDQSGGIRGDEHGTRGYDPYERAGGRDPVAARGTPRPKRPDLRKLGEWIKLRREMEVRKERGETDED